MAKALLYRLFGAGRIPPETADVLLREGVILQDEGLSASATYHHFRAPGGVRAGAASCSSARSCSPKFACWR